MHSSPDLCNNAAEMRINAHHRPPGLATPGTDGALDFPLNDG
ncbi:MAG: hypothetical protein VB125_03145 [Burkholderia sp.]